MPKGLCAPRAYQTLPLCRARGRVGLKDALGASTEHALTRSGNNLPELTRNVETPTYVSRFKDGAQFDAFIGAAPRAGPSAALSVAVTLGTFLFFAI